MLDILNNFSAVLWSSSFLFRFRLLRWVAKLSSNCSGWVWFWWSCYVLLCCPFNPLTFVVWAAKCTIRVLSFLSEDVACTVGVLTVLRISTCTVKVPFFLSEDFPVLSKYLPWCTCKVTSTVVARCLQICCQSTINLGELHLSGVS